VHHLIDQLKAAFLQLQLGRNEAGTSLVEYALLVGLIAVVCAIAMAAFGTAMNGNLSHSGSSIVHAG
jgi:Flp pilus assembly pilin Flp